MKRLLLATMVMLATACNTEQMKYGEGGRNACQYVKEQVPGMRDDIESIEVIDEDSLLADEIFIMAGTRALYEAETNYYNGTISRQQLDAVIDSVAQELTDVEQSWAYGIVVNDSLRKLEKYKSQWRKVYKVQVTMKSGDVKCPRVVMSHNGVTPDCMEKDIERTIREHTVEMTDIIKNIIY